ENLVGNVRLSHFDPEQRAVGGIERGLPQLLGVHFAKALVALDREALAPGGEHRVQQLGRTGDGHRLALGFGFDDVAFFTLERLSLGLLYGSRAFLQGTQRRWPGVRRRLLLGERVELARFGRYQEA